MLSVFATGTKASRVRSALREAYAARPTPSAHSTLTVSKPIVLGSRSPAPLTAVVLMSASSSTSRFYRDSLRERIGVYADRQARSERRQQRFRGVGGACLRHEPSALVLHDPLRREIADVVELPKATLGHRSAAQLTARRRFGLTSSNKGVDLRPLGGGATMQSRLGNHALPWSSSSGAAREIALSTLRSGRLWRRAVAPACDGQCKYTIADFSICPASEDGDRDSENGATNRRFDGGPCRFESH